MCVHVCESAFVCDHVPVFMHGYTCIPVHVHLTFQ